MKYVIFLGDGMSDQPVPELDGRTPLMAADTPNLDRMVQKGVGGWSLNTPEGFYPGSDVANLGVLGYDVRQSYSGRSPLEAAAMGVALAAEDVAFRCNLVTLSQNFAVMEDFSAGQISSKEAESLITLVNQKLASPAFRFHPGVSYRHLLVWHGGTDQLTCIPPHDISDRPIAGHLPRGDQAAAITDLMKASWAFLTDHPVNQARAARGLPMANSIWLWGQGRKPAIQPFQERYGKTGGVISAVDLMRGIAKHIGFRIFHVPGATGWIDTDYEGKAQACLAGLRELDLMFVHVESPDEAGHAGRLDYKIKAIEDLDKRLIGTVLAELEAQGEPFRALALPDHPTPIALKTHTPDRVPFAMYGAGITPDHNMAYDEGLLKTGSLTFNPGCTMMAWFLGQA